MVDRNHRSIYSIFVYSAADNLLALEMGGLFERLFQGDFRSILIQHPVYSIPMKMHSSRQLTFIVAGHRKISAGVVLLLTTVTCSLSLSLSQVGRIDLRLYQHSNTCSFSSSLERVETQNLYSNSF
jgi:hypothetical protein